MKIDGLFSKWKKEEVGSESEKDPTRDRGIETVVDLKVNITFSVSRRLGTSSFEMETLFGNGRRNKQIVCRLFPKL